MSTDNVVPLLEGDVPDPTIYMDVSELRKLYYGRMGVYCSFSDDDEFELTSSENHSLTRPSSILAFSVEDVVGRFVSTPKLYANVFRIRTYNNEKFLNDIRDYGKDDFAKDVQTLSMIHDAETVQYYANKASQYTTITYEFDRLWKMLKLMSKKYGSGAAVKWRNYFAELGYYGFKDPSGLGIMMKERKPCVVVLFPGDVKQFDIVPIQKYKKDKRFYVTDKIMFKMKRMAFDRSAIAKEKTDDYRKDGSNLTKQKPKDNIVKDIIDNKTQAIKSKITNYLKDMEGFIV